MVSTTVALGLTVLTLSAFTALGFWYSRGRGRVRSVEDFLTARNSVGSRSMTATLVASVMGVWILLSPAEAGAAFGGVTAVAGYAVGEAIPMLAYARLGPRIRELLPEGHSLTEYALVRYGPAVYLLVFVVSVTYMFIFLAAELTGITSALQLVAEVPRWQTAVLVGAFVLLYTGYGGLRVSIFTDTVQAVLVIPLLLGSAVAALVALGGPAAVQQNVAAADPSLLDPGFLTGLQFGFWVAIAVLGAELVNQTWWQRIYAAEDAETLRRGFHRAALVNFVLVFVAGLFGVAARGYVNVVTDSASAQYNASVAFFVLVTEAFSETFALAVVLVALLLVMSTADTLFNALASLVTTDLPRVLDDPDDRTLTLSARVLTVVVAVAAIYVSLRARSVLELFLLADLFGVAVAVPLLSGLYSERVTGGGALAAGLSSLAVGLAFFPNPLVRGPLSTVPVVGELLPTPSFLPAFVGTAVVSILVTALSVRTSSSRFDHRRLADAVHSLDDSAVGYRESDD
ncbi:sodium:solute symporter family transporter [Halopelagius longus]|uniref:Sodium:proline symporter n=1 Tax=Halopelagius longus TaxID=1236180 RepID=A0A370IQS5_9EURY|nr:sodium:proline symporter [Halopelagius longus]RDI73075.1 sodium:proline symporter [Halopelagius longus]